MVGVAVIAIDLGVLRENHFSDNNWTVSLQIQGALPMANAFLIGLLISRRFSTTRAFFLGFEATGVMALAFFIMMTKSRRTYAWIDWYTDLWIHFLERTVTRDRTEAFVTLACFGIMIMLSVPQLLFACLCGLLTNWISRHRSAEQAAIAN
jgi:hypothetical protein